MIRNRLALPLLVIVLFLSSLACQGSAALAKIQESSASNPTATSGNVAEAEASATNAPQAVNAAPLPSLSFDLQTDLITLYKQVNPSVVHIFVSDSTGTPLGSGSGFVYDEDGHVVTNNHVVADGAQFELVFADGSHRTGDVVGTDVDSDLAVILVDSLPETAHPVALGNSSDIQVGQFVVAIGNPFGEAGSMSIGIVSGLGRSLESQRIADGGGRYSLPEVIQTDAAINPGNSGGPLLNLQGQVIGVNSAILTSTGSNSGVGFSIPVNAVARVAPALIAKGKYVYPYIGIRMQNISSLELQEALDLPQTNGVYVVAVSPNTPAEAAGLIGSENPNSFNVSQGGDFIIAVDGRPLQNSDDLVSYLVFNAEVGQTITLTVLRNGKEVSVPLTLGERP